MRQCQNGLDEAITSFVDFIRHLPEDRLRPAPGPDWGPREVLAHLAAWHETYASTVKALLLGDAPALPRGTFKGLNAEMVRLSQSVPVDELIARLRRAQDELHRCGAIDEAHGLSFAFREGSKIWPFDRAMELIEGHVRLHHRRLRKRLERTGRRRETGVAGCGGA